MKKLFPVLLLLICLSCTKENTNEPESFVSKGNAEVIGFNPNKCMCCWGWIIRIGKDTIRTTDYRLQELAGLDISAPVPLNIELGERDVQCPDFYYLESIQTVKK